MKILALIAALTTSGILINIRVHQGTSYVSPADAYAAAQTTCGGWALRSTGTKYYFCDCQSGAQSGCTAGSDANAGTSAASPKQTWAAIISRIGSMAAGDTVALCKGGSWTATGSYDARNASCAAGSNIEDPTNTSTCDIRDYQAAWGGSNRPIISRSSGMFLDWEKNSAGGTATAGMRILNLDIRGLGGGPGGTGAGQWAFWWWGGSSDFFVCNNYVDAWDIAVNVQMNDPYGAPNRITLKGNRFTNSGQQGTLSRGNNVVFDANYWDNNGASAVGDHTFYFTGEGVVGTTMRNNEVRYSTATCQGVVAVFHGTLDGVVIENNIIDGGAANTGGCWGISVGPGYTTYEGYTGVEIKRNWVTNGGNLPINVASSPNAIIENNVIAATAGSSSGAICVQECDTNVDMSGVLDLDSTAVTVRNNTIYFTSGASSGSRGVAIGGEGTGHVIANNSVYYASTGGTCFSPSLASGAYSFVGNNACYQGTAFYLAGHDFDTGTELTTNPNFTSIPTDFTPQAGSPLLGAGNWARAPTTDMKIKTRPNPPAIGALER